MYSNSSLQMLSDIKYKLSNRDSKKVLTIKDKLEHLSRDHQKKIKGIKHDPRVKLNPKGLPDLKKSPNPDECDSNENADKKRRLSIGSVPSINFEDDYIEENNENKKTKAAQIGLGLEKVSPSQAQLQIQHQALKTGFLDVKLQC